MTRPPETGPVGWLHRFDRAERWVHGTFAALLLADLATGFALYNAQVSLYLGSRAVVAGVHVACGYALVVPLLLGLLSRAYRADLRRLDRIGADDWRWLRSRERRDGRIEVGKFNAGQKLNGAFTLGATLVLLGTGTLMLFPQLVAATYRTGATFVHDWFSLAVFVVAAGHTAFALRDPVARTGMRTGWVPASWARGEHGRWARELADRDPSVAAAPMD